MPRRTSRDSPITQTTVPRPGAIKINNVHQRRALLAPETKLRGRVGAIDRCGGVVAAFETYDVAAEDIDCGENLNHGTSALG